mgnify:FL=1
MPSLIDGYLAYLGAIRSLSPRTVAAYGNDLRMFSALVEEAGRPVESAEPADVRDFVA